MSKFCDFEQNSTCMFEPIFKVGEGSWKIYQAKDVNTHMSDHTTHTNPGHFSAVDFTHETSHSRDHYRIKSAPTSASRRLQLSYYIDGNGTLTFRVPSSDGGTNTRLWWVAGTTNGLWRTSRNSIP